MNCFAERLARTTLAIVLASSLCVPPAALAVGGDADVLPQTDITPAWKAGDARVEAAGDYVLTDDVVSEGPLVVVLPKGERATVDLAGCSVTVKDGATCAVDLSANEGDVTFFDSAHDARTDRRPKASLTVVNPKEEGDVAAVRAVRGVDTRDAEPKATFSDVKLAANVDVKTRDAYCSAVNAVLTGADERDDWKAEDVDVAVAFERCTLEATSRADSDVREQADEDGVERACVMAVDARCRGIELAGDTDVTVKVDGVDAAHEKRAELASAWEESYALAADFQPVDDNGLENGAAIVFGFPANPDEEEGGAVVARAEEGSCISDSAAVAFEGEGGYTVDFEPAAGEEGYSAVRLVVQGCETHVPESGAVSDGVADAEASELAGVASSRSDVGRSARATLPQDASRFAAEVEAPAPADVLSTQASGTDLNAAWADPAGDYTISSGGSYYLSGDLSASGRLVVNAAGADVSIQLNGHALTLGGGGSATEKALVTVTAARSVTVAGTSAASSAIRSSGDSAVYGVSCTAVDCAVELRDMSIGLTTDSVEQRSLKTHCVRMVDGRSLSMTGCTLVMDFGNQSYRNTSTIVASEPPSAVYALGSVQSVELVDCDITGIGTPAFSLSNIADINSLGNVYAVYSLASSTLVEGGSYKAESALGNATCLYGTSLEIGRGKNAAVELEANAGQLATGVLSTVAGGVAVNAPLRFSVGEQYEGVSQAVAALRSSVSAANGGFVFGDCAPADGSYPALVLVGDDLASANADGYYLGTLVGSLSSGAFGNALGSSASCNVVADASTLSVRFVLDDNLAAARIGANRYSTVAEALAALVPGQTQTLTLLKDAGALAVSSVGNTTIDLNGKTISSLEFSYAGSDGSLVVKNGSIEGVHPGTPYAAVYHHSPSSLSIEDVVVSAQMLDQTVYGVYGATSAGPVSIGGSSKIDAMVSLASTTDKTAYGVFASANGPDLSISGADIAASTPSPAASAYGVCSLEAARVSGSSISASGSTGVVYALCAGGTLEASGTTFDAYTTSAARSSAAVAMRTSPITESIALDGCALNVSSSASSGDLAGSAYACVLGSTSASIDSLSAASLKLSGASTFACVGSGAHLGLNLGCITLGSGFAPTALLDGAPAKLTVSQAQLDANVGFMLDGASSSSALAGVFEAASGSNYEGWKLALDGSKLVWLPNASKANVSLVHGGSTAMYATFGEALGAAASGDTVKLLSSLSEPGAHVVDEDDLVIDLNGKALTLRAGGSAEAGDDLAKAALCYTGSGTLAVKDSSGGTGVLAVQVGSPLEVTAGGTYQGIAVSGGGALDIGEKASVRVDYTGSTSSSAVQYANVGMRGVMVTSGSVRLENGSNLAVSGAPSDGAIGSMATYGILSGSPAGAVADVDVEPGASVEVDNGTVPRTTVNNYYPEITSQGVAGLREITVDRDVDAAFYDDIVERFRATATYDDPDGRTGSFGSGVYYSNVMTLDRDGAWYDGWRLWAYTDVVPERSVGKMDAIVPTHIFVSTHYDTVPQAYGVATSPETLGSAKAVVKGSVRVACSHGDAFALDARCADGGSVSWSSDGAALSATAGSEVHPVEQGAFDLRDYVDFSGSQSSAVAFTGTTSAKSVKLVSPVARDVAIGDNVQSFALSGRHAFMASGPDAAAIQASSFSVDGDFSLASSSETCSVANDAGANEEGAVFAMGATAAMAGLFADAYCACAPGTASDGLAWTGKVGYVATFKVGDAVVARYAEPSTVDLAEPSALAARSDDQRQSLKLVGWSKRSADEHATDGYLGVDEVVSPVSDEVYHAVYETGVIKVPVSFTNVFDGDGGLQPVVTVAAEYGQTVAEALGEEPMPVPADYSDDSGTEYRFAGWCPYTSTSTTAYLYSADQVANLAVTMALDAVSLKGTLELRAVYVPVKPGQHTVCFIVDGYASTCVVDEGTRPVYTMANNTNARYVSPEKLATETGKVFTFESWSDEGGNRYTTSLPKVTQDVTYTADWSWRYADVTLAFYYTGYDAGRTTFYANDSARTSVDTTFDASFQKAADSIMTIGTTEGYKARTYTLLGWSIRPSDAEPLYDAERPIPDLAYTATSVSSVYRATYYGVYKVTDHEVDVTFKDGTATVGAATVESQRSLDFAFAETGAKAPADKSASLRFLGWAADANAKDALNGATTTIESLVDESARALTLYAVYGDPDICTVRLRSADGKSVLYRISVTMGNTVNGTVAKQEESTGKKVSLAPPAVKGKYFQGWRTASGADYDFDAAVTGSVDLYANYQDIEVNASSPAVAAQVTSTSAELEGASSARFSIADARTICSLVNDMVKENGYVDIGYCFMQLVATYPDGSEKVITGDIGTIDLKVAVGTKYASTVVRAFWMGTKPSGGETVKMSKAKSADDSGAVSLSISNYQLGDEVGEGNLALGYLEGGTGKSSLSPSGPGSGSLSTGASPSGLPSSGLGGSALSSSLGSSGPLSSSLSKATGLASSPDSASTKANVLATSQDAGDSDATEQDAAGELADEPVTGSWSSDAVVLVALAALAVLGMLYGLWRLLLGSKRRDEEEADLPSMAERYAKGLEF